MGKMPVRCSSATLLATLGVIKFISKKDNESTPALTFLNSLTTIGYLVLEEFV